jgi:hypothetical protein
VVVVVVVAVVVAVVAVVAVTVAAAAVRVLALVRGSSGVYHCSSKCRSVRRWHRQSCQRHAE